MDKAFWNKRYQENETVYGDEPNVFFRLQLDGLPPGRLLLPAEGEGRNALYAAQAGWQVNAFDFSGQARRKAMEKATRMGVDLDYRLGDVDEMQLPENYFDAIGLIFFHLPPVQRNSFHQRCVTALKPGGVIILEAFRKEQMQYNSGGPKVSEMLYSAAELAADFAALSVNGLSNAETVLAEGAFHQGMASVVRLVASKPNA
jgi:2-polyprenyl-3-methyl-5-hydroxy-6-metoxy-1,4-benzoquinol methylase